VAVAPTIIIIIIIYLLTYLLTAIELSLGGSSPYTSTEKTNNKYTETKKYKNRIQTIQNAADTRTSTHTKHPHICQNNHTLQNPHVHTNPHITKQVKTTTVNEDFLTLLRGSFEEESGQSQDTTCI
jgi:hypothetical protein